MRILVTGVTGYVGGLMAQRLLGDGHDVTGLVRDPSRAPDGVRVVRGDAVTGAGLEAAMRGIEVAYYLIHSMEPRVDGAGASPARAQPPPTAAPTPRSPAVPSERFAALELTAARRFGRAAARAGVHRIVYLGGLAPAAGRPSPHLSSRLAVERELLSAVPGSVALRASIVIGARSRSFRLLVRLVERLPVLAIPAWGERRTAPIDERDIVSMLARAAASEHVAGRSLDAAGPEVVSYRELIARIADAMLVRRPAVTLRRLTVTPIASRLAAVVSGEHHELVGPLMESLRTDLLASADRDAAAALGLRLHSLDSAIEHSLREWEQTEALAAR
ncbi:MAG TPA: NAD(P)H-binding protein [Solirubrobacteraceae bacterium]|nr:NAD(P)H-binding protein [Solirubrobacteraceae bacterium]